MDLIQAIVLGIVQGLTEFLPISSSAHLVFVPWLFGWTDPAVTSVQFDVALHLGTVLAVITYFWSDWVRLIKAFIASLVERKIGSDTNRRIAWFVLLASIPAGVVGALAESKIEDLFHEPANLRSGLLIIAVMMMVMGGLLLLSERLGRHATEMAGISFTTAIGIGLAQALALIPGVSRSGSTITAGLFFGLTRATAARFSFLLATPVILGAGLKKIYDLFSPHGGQPAGIPADMQLGFAAGFLSAAIVGFLCIHFLLQYLQHRSTAPFIWYRFMVGIALIVLVLVGYNQ